MGAVINRSRWEGMHPFCFIQKVSLYLLSLRSRRGQGIELRRAEKFAQCDAEAIAQSLDSHRAGILALTEKDAFDGGLRHVGYFAQFVGRDALLSAKPSYATGNSLPRFHCLFPPCLCDYTS